MDLLLDLLQGGGLAAAVGIRPFLPVLLAGALASADAGLDFEGTDFAFLEAWPFLLAAVVGLMLLDFGARRAGHDAADRPPLLYVLLGIALVFGALLAAGSVADRSSEWWAGAIVGVACAALGFEAARSLFGRVRRRLDPEAANALPVYAEAPRSPSPGCRSSSRRSSSSSSAAWSGCSSGAAGVRKRSTPACGSFAD